jgi:sialate O-acetylesterase
MNKGLLCVLLTCITLSLKAEIKLPALVGSNMVLQRGKPMRIWGSAKPDEAIIISFNNKTARIKANADGKWNTTLPKMSAGGPFTMTLQGENKIVLQIS